jgi:hypothetical protein
MGNTVPPKGWLSRFQRRVRPTLPAFSVAPMTAMLFGLKMALREWRGSRRKIVVGAPPLEADGPPVSLVSMCFQVLSVHRFCFIRLVLRKSIRGPYHKKITGPGDRVTSCSQNSRWKGPSNEVNNKELVGLGGDFSVIPL